MFLLIITFEVFLCFSGKHSDKARSYIERDGGRVGGIMAEKDSHEAMCLFPPRRTARALGHRTGKSSPAVQPSPLWQVLILSSEKSGKKNH